MLNLAAATITLWNAVYLERAVATLRQQQNVDNSFLTPLAPLERNHINMTGYYVWHAGLSCGGQRRASAGLAHRGRGITSNGDRSPVRCLLARLRTP